MNPIQKALAQADAVIDAQNALEALSREGRLVVIPVGGTPQPKAGDTIAWPTWSGDEAVARVTYISGPGSYNTSVHLTSVVDGHTSYHDRLPTNYRIVKG